MAFSHIYQEIQKRGPSYIEILIGMHDGKVEKMLFRPCLFVIEETIWISFLCIFEKARV